MYKVLPKSGVGERTDDRSSFHEIRPRPNHVKDIYGHRIDILESRPACSQPPGPFLLTPFVEILAPGTDLTKGLSYF